MRLIKLHYGDDKKMAYINPLHVTTLIENYVDRYNFAKNKTEEVNEGTEITFCDYDTTIRVRESIDVVASKINDEFNKLAINNVETLTIN